MNNFIFQNSTKVYFGKGGVKEYLGSLLQNYGDTVMLAYGRESAKCNGVYDEVAGILRAQGKTVVDFSGIMPNPTYAKVQEGAKLAREKHVDLILAVGGGSVSDCCKVIAAQAKLSQDIWDMEVVKHTYPTEFIPLGTIMTVFGTGSEMNAGAVITHEEKKLKSGIFGAQADFAFLDPAYTLSVPFGQVISGTFDTLSHAMETYFGKPDENSQVYTSSSYIRDYDLIGIVKSYDAENGIATITQRNRFFKGDEIEIIQPMKPFFVQAVDSMCDENGNEIEVANHAEQIVKFKTAQPVCEGAMIRKKK